MVEEKEKKDARREARASVRASRAKAGPPLRLPSCSGSSSDEMSESIGEMEAAKFFTKRRLVEDLVWAGACVEYVGPMSTAHTNLFQIL